MRPPQLRYAILELSLRCNLRCIHCASASGPPRADELSLAEWLPVVDDLAELGCEAVDLMGGEVLLSPILGELGAALAGAGLAWGILTNGWLLDEPRARALHAAGCRGIGVSLDGALAATHDAIRGRAGSHERALRALEVLGSLDLKPRNRSVLTSVNSRNVGELEALGELLSRRFPGYRWQLNLSSAEAPRLPAELRLDGAGVERVARFVDEARRTRRHDLAVSAAHDLGYYMDAELDLHDHEPWDGCPAGIRHVGVQSDSRVKPCLALDERFAVGAVRERSLRELWEGDAFAAWRAFDERALGERCRGCVWASRCRGGCAAYSTAHGGLHDHPHCLWRTASPAARARAERPALAGSGGGSPHLIEEGEPEPPADDETAPPGDGWRLPLRSACIELTLRCNLRCVHCGSAAGEPRRSELELATFIPLLRDLRLLGGERVVLLGGEPLLHPDWREIVAMASGFGLRAALITNGLPVSERVARELAELRPSHVGVSIDGACDDVHDAIRGVAGARRRAWAAVRRLRGAGLPVTVITTLVRSNVAELEALHDQLAAEGGLVWQLQLANGSGDRFSRELLLRPAEVLRVARFVAASRARGAGDPAIAGGHNIGHHACGVRDEEYGPRGRWRGCPGGLTAIGICSDGSVKGCLSMRECEVQGNLHQRSLVEIWRDPSCFARSRSSRPGLLRGGCARCPHGAECRGGCPETARSASGDVWDNPLCLRQAEELEAGA